MWLPLETFFFSFFAPKFVIRGFFVVVGFFDFFDFFFWHSVIHDWQVAVAES